MDAVEFIEKNTQMCNSYGRCSKCPIIQEIMKSDESSQSCGQFRKAHPDVFVSIVEKWSKEHPVITNAMKFEEIFGGKPRIPPSNELICPPPFTWPEGKCTDCVECKKWWGDPYKKPEKKNND